jgi:hypothetical protein
MRHLAYCVTMNYSYRRAWRSHPLIRVSIIEKRDFSLLYALSMRPDYRPLHCSWKGLSVIDPKQRPRTKQPPLGKAQLPCTIAENTLALRLPTPVANADCSDFNHHQLHVSALNVPSHLIGGSSIVVQLS